MNKIWVINPNTTQAMTARIEACARAVAHSGVVAVAPVLVPVLAPAAQYTWFIGMIVGLAVYTAASKR